MPAVRPIKARPSRVVPYEQVISLDLRAPAPPPRANASSMAHVLSQTNQPQHPPPQHPYSHPAYQHYPPPTYPYPPPPQPPPPYGPTYYYRPQHPVVVHTPEPLLAHGPLAAPPPPPPQSQPPQAAPTPTRPDVQWQEGEDPAADHTGRARLSEDDTLLIRIALRWIFVREQSASPSTFWIDVTKSFEKAIGRKFASVKRKIASLEEQWRAKFAVRDAQPGLQGNNNTELARAMRAWIAFRDEEERVKREKEEDEKALAVRRERLHELESERLGLTDVCRYETTMVGEEEEAGPPGVDTGDRSNPISLEDAVDEEPQQPRPVNNLYRDLEPTDTSNEKAKKADPVAPIVELLRKRQREEREEADIRREEQVLLNKRLAMMEEQIQMLGKLITQREQRPQTALQPASQLAPPPRHVIIDLDGDANESAEAPARFQAGAGARPQPVPQPRLAAIEMDVNVNESTEAPTGPQADAGAVGASSSTEARAEVAKVSTVPGANLEAANASNSTETSAEIAEVSPDIPMPDVPANTTAGSETAAVHTDESNDTTGPETVAGETSQSNDASTGAVEYSPDVSMDGSADVPGKTPAESGTEIPDDTAEAQIDVGDSPGTTDAPTTAEGEGEGEDVPEDTDEAQERQSGDEESIATPISEEE